MGCSPKALSEGTCWSSWVISSVASQTAGREWAVGAFVVLVAVALLCMLVRLFVDSRAAQQKTTVTNQAKAADFASFQRSYLSVYVIIMLADWMQGTHMYTLYSSYAKEEGSNVAVGTLFFTGFVAAAVFGTPTGPFVDRYGRKRACLVYIALELTINFLEHFNHMGLLLVGRVLGGISTSLLFSAFEAWMVTEHRIRGFPEEWIGRTFALCAVWNGATAIVAGVLAQISADIRGDIGPFQLAMALTALAGLNITSWTENYGSTGGDHGDGNSGGDSSTNAGGTAGPNGVVHRSTERTTVDDHAKGAVASAESAESGESGEAGLWAAWLVVRGDSALLVVGAVYALFEGAMYTFVFNWVPTLASALGGYDKIAPVQGLIFSCLMAAISIGGEVYGLAARFLAVETIGVLIFLLSFVCMAVPVVCGLYGCGIHASFGVHFAAFLGFEMCVGAFQPCVATHRSKYVPDAQQSTVNNLFRLPLNMLVAAGTMLSDYLPQHQIFLMCASAHALATLCQAHLALRVFHKTAKEKRA